MRVSWACGAACFLSAITIACCSLALQLDVTESVNRRHEPRQPVWPGQYQVWQQLISCQWLRLLAVSLVCTLQIRDLIFTLPLTTALLSCLLATLWRLACESWCMLAQVSYDVDVPYVSKLQSTPLRCSL